MNYTTRRLISLVGLATILVALACAPCSCLSRLGAPPPPERVEVSQEAAQRLEKKVKEAMSGTSNGEFTITATDEEVTSLIAEQLEKSSDTPMRDVQVHFGDDRIHVWAIFADDSGAPELAELLIAGDKRDHRRGGDKGAEQGADHKSDHRRRRDNHLRQALLHTDAVSLPIIPPRSRPPRLVVPLLQAGEVSQPGLAVPVAALWGTVRA